MTNDTIVISKQQRGLHVVSEAMALLITVPFFFYASRRLPTAMERKTALWMGVGALVVDGFLLFRYVTGTTHQPIFGSPTAGLGTTCPSCLVTGQNLR